MVLLFESWVCSQYNFVTQNSIWEIISLFKFHYLLFSPLPYHFTTQSQRSKSMAFQEFLMRTFSKSWRVFKKLLWYRRLIRRTTERPTSLPARTSCTNICSVQIQINLLAISFVIIFLSKRRILVRPFKDCPTGDIFGHWYYSAFINHSGYFLDEKNHEIIIKFILDLNKWISLEYTCTETVIFGHAWICPKKVKWEFPSSWNALLLAKKLSVNILNV